MRAFSKKKNIIYDLSMIPNLDKRRVFIVFYKSNYAFWSRWIKKWTGGKYSHCEVFISGIITKDDPEGLLTNDCWLIGISDEQNVRALNYDPKEVTDGEKWEAVEIPATIKTKFLEKLVSWFEFTKGSKYDWKGIFKSNIFARRIHSEDKYTCSEWMINLLDQVWSNIIYPKWFIIFTPQDVYDTLNFFLAYHTVKEAK